MSVVFVVRAFPLRLLGTVTLGAVLVLAAGLAGAVPPLVAVALGVGAAAVLPAVALVCLALAIHAAVGAWTVCRGSGYLGVGVVAGAVSVVALPLVGPDHRLLVAVTGLAAATGGYLLGLLLLPGVATTTMARLRRAFDGLGVGVSLSLAAWLMLPREAASHPVSYAATMIGVAGVSTIVITVLRSTRRRSATLRCGSGAALAVVGQVLLAAAIEFPAPAWALVAAALPIAAGPAVIWAGARRSDATPRASGPASADGSFGGYPLLAVPVGLALLASAYHLVVVGTPDRTAVLLAMAVGAVLAGREVLAATDVRRYARRLAGQEARLRALVTGASDVAMVLSDELVVQWQSPAAARQFGLYDADVVGHPFTDLVHPDDLVAVVDWLRAAAHADATPGGGPAGRGAAGGGPPGGTRPVRLLPGGTPPADRPAPGDRPAADQPPPVAAPPPASAPPPAAAPANDRPANGARMPALVEARMIDGYGRWRETESSISDLRASPEVGALVVHVRDVGERRHLERTLDRLASTDHLTGLPNRRELMRAVAARQGGGHRTGALLVIDLHGLAGVSDLRGRAACEAVLVEAALRLRVHVGPEDMLARLAEGQLAVVTADGPIEAYGLGVRLLAALTGPYQLPDRPVHLQASVGLAGLTAGVDADDVLRRGTLALRLAGQLGRNRIEWYDESLEEQLVRRLDLERHLPGAAGRNELDLLYQPITELASHRPVGVEALVRWRHPFLGTVLPCELLPIADKLQVSEEIGEWVLHTACRQAAAWRRDGHDLWLAVNVNAQQLTGDFVPEVAAALSVHQIPPERLTVELAESEVGEDVPTIATQLSKLRALGVRTALDDFGAGHTDLARLRRLPLDVVKLAPPSATGTTGGLATAVVDVARRLGLAVVAEGLETPDQVTVVREAGCRYGQGFQLARPAPAEQVGAYLAGLDDRSIAAR